jgi:hypothetical protein
MLSQPNLPEPLSCSSLFTFISVQLPFFLLPFRVSSRYILDIVSHIERRILSPHGILYLVSPKPEQRGKGKQQQTWRNRPILAATSSLARHSRVVRWICCTLFSSSFTFLLCCVSCCTLLFFYILLEVGSYAEARCTPLIRRILRVATQRRRTMAWDIALLSLA